MRLSSGAGRTDPDSILADIEWVVETFKPKNVDVFQISPTPEYVDEHFGGSIDAFWAHLQPFQEQAVPALKALAERMRYTVNVRAVIDTPPSGHGAHPASRVVRRTATATPSWSAKGGSPCICSGSGRRRVPRSSGARPTRASLQNMLSDAPFHYAGHLMDFDDEVRTYLVHQPAGQ